MVVVVELGSAMALWAANSGCTCSILRCVGSVGQAVVLWVVLGRTGPVFQNSTLTLF